MTNLKADEPNHDKAQGDELPLVWIAILNYEGASDTKICLQSLKLLDYPRYRILILDNGSEDRAIDTVASQFPDIEYIRSPHNLGFAGGCNKAIRHCASLGAQWVWMLNNDTIVQPDTLSHLVACAIREPEAALLGALVFSNDGDKLVPRGGGSIDFRKGKTYERTVPPPGASEIACEWLSGSNLLIRMNAFDQADGYDEKFFLYYEDADLCLRLRNAGWRCLMVPPAHIKHIGLQSTKGSRSTWRHYYHIRNRMLFFSKHAVGINSFMIKLSMVLHLARHSASLPFRGEEGRRQLKAELLGYRDFVNKKFGQAECLDW